MVVCISNANSDSQKLEKYSQTNSNVKYILKVDITMSVECSDCGGCDATQLCSHPSCKGTGYGWGVCDECMHPIKGNYAGHKCIPLSEAKRAAECDMDKSFHRHLSSRAALWKLAEEEELDRFENGISSADEAFIWPQQEKDAMKILELASEHHHVLVEKELKLGAEGTILAIARAIETGKAPKDSDGRPRFTACICITGMSNNSWGKSLLLKTGTKGWAADYVAHCGVKGKKDYDKLETALEQNGNIMPDKKLQRCLIIWDECDLGDGKKGAVSKFLNRMFAATPEDRNENGCTLVSITATSAAPNRYLHNHCARQQELELLGVIDATSARYRLVVPETYKGLRDFQTAQIIVNQLEGPPEVQVRTWLGYLKKSYNDEHRVHLFRLPKTKKAKAGELDTRTWVEILSVRVGFKVYDYNSTDRDQSELDWNTAFEAARAGTASSILILKPNGLLGRATRIVPDDKKLVGSIYEAGTGANIDAIVQSLIGRMCGHDFAAKKLVCATHNNQVTPEEHRMGPFYVKAGAVDCYLKDKDGGLEPGVPYTATGGVQLNSNGITKSRTDGSIADVPTAEGESEGPSKAVKEYLLLGGVKVDENTKPTDEQLGQIEIHHTKEAAIAAANKWLFDLNQRGCNAGVNVKDGTPRLKIGIHKRIHNPKLHTCKLLWEKGKITVKKGHWKDATTYKGKDNAIPVAIRKVSETEERYVVLVKLPVPTP